MGSYLQAVPMSDCCIRIEREKNGWEVSIDDPEIMKANRNAKDGKWRDPRQEYKFSTIAEVTAFLTKAMPIIEKTEPDYTSVFDKLVKDNQKED